MEYARTRVALSETLPSLAIARMFGGIPNTFFSSYHKNMAKSEPVEQYDLRGDLYELYHYLNHTVLFGVSRHNSRGGRIDDRRHREDMLVVHLER